MHPGSAILPGCILYCSLRLEGYKEAIRRLEPECVIRYGEKMPGEAEEMSVYFENENYKMLNNGRER